MQSYRAREFEAIMEYFDKYHEPTRKILLSIEEADQNQVLTALTGKLYDKIVAKSADIDYGSIPESKGDITKIENFSEIIEILNIIRDLLVNYRQPTTSVDIVNEAIENLQKRKDEFERCFRYGIEFGVVLYNNIALAIVTSVSLLIRASIEFIKSPDTGAFKLAIDRASASKTKDALLLDNLEKFNHACKRGDIDKALDHITRTVTKNFAGANLGVIAGGIAIIGLIFSIIPIMRELIYYFYHLRVSVSDTLEYQANLLKMNAYKLEADTERDPEEIKRIVKKQLQVSSVLEKIGSKFALSNKKATIETERDMKKFENEEKNMKIDDVIDPSNLTSAEPVDNNDARNSALF